MYRPIFEVNRDIAQVIEQSVDPETGEINEEALAELDALQIERTEKLEAVALAVKNLRVETDGLKAEETALKERRERKERRAETLKRFLSRELDGERLETTRALVSFRRSSAVEVSNDLLARSFLSNQGYGDCLRFKDPEIVKTAVKRLLGTGVEVPGVELVSRLSMSIK